MQERKRFRLPFCCLCALSLLVVDVSYGRNHYPELMCMLEEARTEKLCNGVKIPSRIMRQIGAKGGQFERDILSFADECGGYVACNVFAHMCGCKVKAVIPSDGGNALLSAIYWDENLQYNMDLFERRKVAWLEIVNYHREKIERVFSVLHGLNPEGFLKSFDYEVKRVHSRFCAAQLYLSIDGYNRLSHCRTRVNEASHTITQLVLEALFSAESIAESVPVAVSTLCMSFECDVKTAASLIVASFGEMVPDDVMYGLSIIANSDCSCRIEATCENIRNAINVCANFRTAWKVNDRLNLTYGKIRRMQKSAEDLNCVMRSLCHGFRDDCYKGIMFSLDGHYDSIVGALPQKAKERLRGYKPSEIGAPSFLTRLRVSWKNM
jgi:hypothetical protein